MTVPAPPLATTDHAPAPPSLEEPSAKRRKELEEIADRLCDDLMNQTDSAGDLVIHVRVKPSGRLRIRAVQEGLEGCEVRYSHYGDEPDAWPGLENV